MRKASCVAGRVGIEGLAIVGLPGHVVLSLDIQRDDGSNLDDSEEKLFIDCFRGGQRMSTVEIMAFLPNIDPSHMRPSTNSTIWIRAISNVLNVVCDSLLCRFVFYAQMLHCQSSIPGIIHDDKSAIRLLQVLGMFSDLAMSVDLPIVIRHNIELFDQWEAETRSGPSVFGRGPHLRSHHTNLLDRVDRIHGGSSMPPTQW